NASIAAPHWSPPQIYDTIDPAPIGDSLLFIPNACGFGAPSVTEIDLIRFVDTQAQVYSQVVEELTDGHKRTHWMCCGSSFRNCPVWVIAPWLSDIPSGI